MDTRTTLFGQETENKNDKGIQKEMKIHVSKDLRWMSSAHTKPKKMPYYVFRNQENVI